MFRSHASIGFNRNSVTPPAVFAAVLSLLLVVLALFLLAGLQENIYCLFSIANYCLLMHDNRDLSDLFVLSVVYTVDV